MISAPQLRIGGVRRRMARTSLPLVAIFSLAGCLPQAPALSAASTAAGNSRSVRGLAKVARAGPRHLEYVVPDGSIYVYDIDRHHRLLQRIPLPGIGGIRGLAASPSTHTLYVSFGGDGGSNGTGALLALNLLDDRIMWTRGFRHGVDSLALSADGRRIYLPSGELAPDGNWYVLDARTGRQLARIATGTVGPHNTVVGPSGRRVYLGPRNSPFLIVADTATNRVLRRVGPLAAGVRPFTVNGSETLAFTTATGRLGFQVSSLISGRVLYSVGFGARFRLPASYAPTAPSHGITLSPDGRYLWVLDGPHSFVHLYDVSGLPARPPRHLADIRLRHPLAGTESPCGYDCARDGWLQSSRDGCFIYVGDSGDVISTRQRRPVAFLPALRESRKSLEIDWRGGAPFATSTRIGVGLPPSDPALSKLRCP